MLDDPGNALDARGIQRPDFSMGSAGVVIDAAFPEWGKEFYDRIHADLAADGLAHTISGTMSAGGVWWGRTTPLGKRFLRFITEPE
jgi:hypothetical protein